MASSSASSSAGYGCAEFQKLSKTKGGRECGDEDKMVEELAMKNKWRRCPGCKYYVEKSGGCDVINCRCGCQFFYGDPCGTLLALPVARIAF